MIRAGATARILPDRRRLYLNHGPIDLVVEACGDHAEVCRAYEQAWRIFPPILPDLVRELALLRRPVGEIEGDPIGPVARRMVAASRRHHGIFVTPMAAVAGAVAEYVLEHMLRGCHLTRAYVNNGGDIAVHLADGQDFTCGLVADLRLPALCGRITMRAGGRARGIATSGRACSGQGGRSFSLGIADAVTVLAATAAEADVAATLLANAVDLPGHAAVTRAPARDLDPDSDLGRRLVTLDVGPLTLDEVRRALRRGEDAATRMHDAGLIEAAALLLRGHYALVGQPLGLVAA